MKVLKLTLNKKWFDLIASGEKIEEYREFKKHWIQRLLICDFPEEEFGEKKKMIENFESDFKFDLRIHGYIVEDVLIEYFMEFKKFDFIEFTNGYGNDKPKLLMEFKGTSIGIPKNEGAEMFQDEVFIIKIGAEIKRTNF